MSQSPDNSVNTIIFTCVTACICAVGLAVAATALKPRQQENIAVDKMKNILKAFDVLDAAVESGSVATYFEANIEGVVVNEAGEVLEDAPAASEIDYEAEYKAKAKDSEYEPMLPVFMLKQEGEVVAYTTPVMGKGLWSTLLGYMAFDADLNNVRGITFYSHGETPGLGAEIVETPFEAQWVGKKIVASGKAQAIKVVKPGNACPTSEEHCVDGVSGATITSRGVDAMVEQAVAMYDPYLKSRR